MKRLRFYDCRLSRLPSVLGLCEQDRPRLAAYVNSAQRRLLYAREAGEEGWWGTWAEIAFPVSREQPYVTFPQEIARLELVQVCEHPVRVHNQFYEYLEFGNGRLPKQALCRLASCDRRIQAYARNSVPTHVDLSNPPQYLRFYIDEEVDEKQRILVQGQDANGNRVFSVDGVIQVEGIFVELGKPFVTTPFTFSSITGIQKDYTLGPVRIFQVDPETDEEKLLSVMQPGELTGSYRRYYFHNLPADCGQWSGTPQTLWLKAIAKLDFVPVVVDTDWCLIQNLEAIIEEAQSVRYSEMDTGAAKTFAAERHAQAIRLLNGELNHYLGKDSPAVMFSPFGSATLEKKAIGTLL